MGTAGHFLYWGAPAVRLVSYKEQTSIHCLSVQTEMFLSLCNGLKTIILGDFYISLTILKDLALCLPFRSV